MKLFELVSNEPIVNVEALLIPQFKAIWDADKSKNKTTAHKELSYVYFSADFKSIYLSYDPSVRLERLNTDIMDNPVYKPSRFVVEAIKKYEELQNTPTMRFLQANRKAMESMESYFNSIDWEEETSKGQPKYKITEITRAVKEAGGIIDNINKLEDKVKKELAMSDTKARGGGVGGDLEFM
jgi:hypothetical protein